MNRLDMLALNEKGFAFDPMSGESFSLNESAVKMITLIRKEEDAKSIATRLSEDFDVSFNDAYTDALEFMEKLKHHGLMD